MRVAQDPGIERTHRAVAYSVLSGAGGLVLAPFVLFAIAALTYQVTWQRLLYAEFGVDLQPITIIVSCFMLGLGLGSFLCRLAPGGILAFDSTAAPDAIVTARSVLSHVYQFQTFVVASNQALPLNAATAMQRIGKIRLPDGTQPNIGDSRTATKIASMVATFQPYEERDLMLPAPRIITDQNMLTEYRHGTRLWWWH